MTNINIVGKFDKYLYPRIVPLVLDESQKQRLKLTKYYDAKTSEEEKKEILKMIVSTTTYHTTLYTTIAATTNVKEKMEREEINRLLSETQKTREQYWFDFLGQMLKHIRKMVLDLSQFRQFLFINMTLINKQFTELLFFSILEEHNNLSVLFDYLGKYGRTIIDYYLISLANAQRIILLYYLKTIHPIDYDPFRFIHNTPTNTSTFLNIIRTTIMEFSEMGPGVQLLVEKYLTEFIGKVHYYFRTRIHVYITEFMNLYYLQRKKDPTLTKMDKDDELYALQIIEGKKYG